MWSILERMTDTIGAKYDETIERATWRFDDRGAAKELLGHLRFRRNQYVHAAKSGEKPDQVAYMLKRFVELHLWTLIRNDFRITSFRGYGDFLRLPTNAGVLKERLGQLQRALRVEKDRV